MITNIADIEFDAEVETSPMQRLVTRACSCTSCKTDLLPHDFPLPKDAVAGWSYEHLAGWQRLFFYADGSDEHQVHYSPMCERCFKLARGSKVCNGKAAKGSATAGAYTTMARTHEDTKSLRSA